MFQQYYEDLVALFIPPTCIGCLGVLIHEEKGICTTCLGTIQQTNDHLTPASRTMQKFTGKVPIERVSTLYHFSKRGRVQRILHAIKYKSHKHLAYQVGLYYAHLLKQDPYYTTLDLIIPIPLHKERLKERGYNQSAHFAHGLAKGLNIPYKETYVERSLKTETQTNKTKLARWENVKAAFHLPNPSNVKGLHILLVDDLITTGATLEACADTLLRGGAASITIAGIAVAHL